MANYRDQTYQNFDIPIINQGPTGWEAMNQNLGQGADTFTSFLLQRKLVEEQQKQELGMMLMKQQMEQQNYLPQAMAEQQAKSQFEDQSFNNSVNRMRQYPELFGMSSGQPQMNPGQQPGQGLVNPMAAGPSMPQMGQTMNPMMQGQAQAPAARQPSAGGNMSPFVFLINPGTGKLERVENPEFKMQQDIGKEQRGIALEKEKMAMQPENADASSAITYTNLMSDEINTIKKIVDKPDFDWGLYGAAKASKGSVSAFTYNQGIPVLNQLMQPEQRQDLIQVTNSLNAIKRSVFGEGGKTLTDNEKAIIFRTLEPTGQNKEDWMKLLNQSLSILQSKAKLQAKNPDRINSGQDTDAEYQRYLQAIGAQ